jgi:phosphatidylserine decarboxylase
VAAHDVSIQGGVPVRWRIVLALLHVLPQAQLSRLFGRIAELRLPGFIQGPLNRAFAWIFRVDLTESEGTPDDYASLSAFFVRALRPGAREYPQDPAIPVSPADGIVGACGRLREGVAIQAKGIEYDVARLLAAEADAERFRSGVYFTIYLSPRHYHRVHAPVGAELWEARAVPGRLLPVNPASVRAVRDLFPRNERLVTRMGNGRTDLALVAVGAVNVGRISATFDVDWNGPSARGVTNRGGRPAVEVRRYDPPRRVERGEEVMAFHLGSTVILLLSSPVEGTLEISPALQPGAEIRIGTPLLDGPLPP